MPDLERDGQATRNEDAGMCLCQNGEQVDHVTDLDFRNCNLKQVPQEIFQYAQSLTHLQLDSNTLSDLPKSLFSCSSLEYLTASDNDLGALPASLAGLSNLKYLDISKNVVEDIPDCIKCCKSLSVLDASVNPIERLSDGFTQLVGLSELYLNDCFLEFLPANFGRLVQLNVLELRDNQLQILPKSIRRLCLLKRLDLGGNVFQEWPDVVCELRRLTELWLDGNELGKVPEQVGELSALVYLDLSRNFIESIPGQIGSLRQLTDLLLCENHITYLPDSIGFLDKLTMLKASMNQLVRIPESIGKLKEVEELDLSHNKLEEIPPTIGNLTMMHTLLLDNNALSYVPAEIGGCERLNVLQLSRNRLDEIPKEVGELSELRVFNICRNRLPYLPITVIKLAQLEALWVSSNQSKPNVPLHAEMAGDGKTRILTNVLFPQTEQGTLKSRAKTDSDGYANDAADDDEPPLFRKQRGVTRVAFNLRPVCYNSSDDDYSDEDKIRENGDMVIDIPAKDHNSNEKFPVSDQGNSVDVSDAVMSNNGLHLQPLTLSVRSPDKSDDSIDGPESAVVSPTNGLLSDELRPPSYHAINAEDQSDERAAASPKTQVEETESEPKSVSVPDLRKSPEKPEEDTILSNPEIESPADSEYEDSPRIKTWSSHSHLPAIPNSSGDLKPVAAEIISDQSSVSSSNGAENVTKVTRLPIPSQAIFNKGPADSIGEIKIDNSPKPPRKDPLEDIPFVDSEISDESDASALVLKAQLGKSPKKPKPPPPPRKDSLLNKTKFAQNETGGASKLPTVSPKTTASTSATVSTPATPSGLKIFTPALLNRQKSLSYDSEDLPLPPLDDRPPLDGLPPTDRDSGVGNDVDSQESIPECEEGATKATAPAVPPKPSKIAASIKMFESISVDPKSPNAGSKTLADLLPTGPRRIDDKAIIKPNNHLDDSVLEKAAEPPVKPQIPREIMSDTREVVFSRRNDDITDAAAFSKALNEISTAPERRKITRSRSDSGESAKQTQFRERLEKIMQQQKSVSAASKAAQGGAALSLSRKASFNSVSQPTSPDGSGLEKLTADSAFPVPEHFQTPSTQEFKSPVKKSVSDKLKNKLDRGSNGAPVKSPSSSRIARSRPGSAPAAQLLQRRNSNPRNSLSA